MVLPTPPPDGAPRQEEGPWFERLLLLLGLIDRGVLILVDHAQKERLRELVLALLAQYPDLEVHAGIRRLPRVPHGAVILLQPSAHEATWLNLNRPLFHSRALKAILWCDTETAQALTWRAPDFMDWKSLRLECPPGLVAHAVSGLRAATQAPGVVWQGERLEESLSAAFPEEASVTISAALEYPELQEKIRDAEDAWLRFTEVDGDFRLRRVRWAMAEAGREGSAILVEPAVRSPGWWTLHSRTESLEEALASLEEAGAQYPGRLAALTNLEPESVRILAQLVAEGADEPTLTTTLRDAQDPGATLAALAHERGLVDLSRVATGEAEPPLLRGLAGQKETLERREEMTKKLSARLSQGQSLTPQEAGFWATGTDAASADILGRAVGLVLGYLIEAFLRRTPDSPEKWQALINAAVEVGDFKVAEHWAARIQQPPPNLQDTASSLFNDVLSWILPITSFDTDSRLEEEGKYEEAIQHDKEALEALARVFGQEHPSVAYILFRLASSLQNLARYSEALSHIERARTVLEKVFGEEPPVIAAYLLSWGNLLTLQGKYEEALSLLERAGEISSKTMPPGHYFETKRLELLALTLKALGRYQDALTILERLLGPEHEEVKRLRALLE